MMPSNLARIDVCALALAQLSLALAACAALHQRPEVSAPQPAVEVVAPEPTAADITAGEWLALGRSALEAGELHKATSCLDSAVSRDPRLIEAHFLLGQIAERGQRFEEAVGHYRALLAQAPNHRIALRALGNLLLTRTKDFSAGVKLFAQALEGAPFDPEWLNAQALFSWHAGDTEGARDCLRKLLSRHPSDATAYETLTLIAIAQGEHRLADLFSKRALELAPEDAIAHHGRALFLMSTLESGDRAGAAAHLRRALEIDPELTEAWFNLGNLALAHRDYALAHQAFERTRALDPDHPGLNLRLAWTFEGLRDERGAPRLSEAVEHYEQQLSRAAQDVEALIGLARLCEGPLKELDRALALYERALAALAPGAQQGEVRLARDRLQQRIDLEAELSASTKKD